jgi:hypothetical protein
MTGSYIGNGLIEKGYVTQDDRKTFTSIFINHTKKWEVWISRARHDEVNKLPFENQNMLRHKKKPVTTVV